MSDIMKQIADWEQLDESAKTVVDLTLRKTLHDSLSRRSIALVPQLASLVRALYADKVRLDWLNEHEAEISVSDDEGGTTALQSNQDYIAGAVGYNYNIRVLIDAARRVSSGAGQPSSATSRAGAGEAGA